MQRLAPVVKPVGSLAPDHLGRVALIDTPA